MTKEELLESGILESYVLGQCTKSEEALLEEHLSDPDVKSELEEIELLFENIGQTKAFAPRPELKAKIDAELFGVEEKKEEPLGKEVSINRGSGANSIVWKIAAGFILLLAVSSFWFLSGKITNLEQTLAEEQSQNSSLKGNLQQVSQEVNHTSAELDAIEDFFANKVIKSFELHSPTNPNEVFGIVYWCPATGDVMLNGMNLPKLEKDEQFQLWALVGGKPLDLGVLPKEWDSADHLAKVKGLKELNAYAITIEPVGGSENPTMDRLTAIAEI